MDLDSVYRAEYGRCVATLTRLLGDIELAEEAVGDDRGPGRRPQGGDRTGDGHRESTESWADLLRSCKRRGMRAPVLAVGDGALGFWAAIRDVFPETREQRC